MGWGLAMKDVIFKGGVRPKCTKSDKGGRGSKNHDFGWPSFMDGPSGPSIRDVRS